MLTSLEVANLEHGLLEIQTLGPDAAVPFPVNRLCNASVAWVNERWFLERQLDITDKGVRARLDRWLLEEFAYIVPFEGSSTADLGGPVRTFFADRYGSPDMATHGGSGRVGITGRFQVKGIGKTPLVGVASDWLHSHGCLWFEEALREAVYSEIVATEFPHGAVPTLAIIDTGLRHTHENGSRGERRALAVRPVVVRPAYFERAIAFQPPGREHEERLRDVKRVKQIVSYFESRSRQPGEPSIAELFTTTFTRLAQQIAFARAHRLFPGNYASSNICMDGSLLDFGPFRALPNWCRSISVNDVEGFGNEIVELTEVIKSIAFYVNKYVSGQTMGVDSSELLEKFNIELGKSFAKEILSLLGLNETEIDSVRQVASAALLEYYNKQQRVEVRFQNGCKQKLDWLGDVFSSGKTMADAVSPEAAVLARLAASVQACELGEREKSALSFRMWTTARRLLPTRREIAREALARSLNELIESRDGSDIPATSGIEEEVNRIISKNRRHWPLLPRNLIVLAQSANQRGTILYCLDPDRGGYCLWVEAISVDGRIWCGDGWVEQTALEPYKRMDKTGWWFGLFPVTSRSAKAVLDEICIELPGDAVWFCSAQNTDAGEIFRVAEIMVQAEVETAGSQRNERVNYA